MDHHTCAVCRREPHDVLHGSLALFPINLVDIGQVIRANIVEQRIMIGSIESIPSYQIVDGDMKNENGDSHRLFALSFGGFPLAPAARAGGRWRRPRGLFVFAPMPGRVIPHPAPSSRGGS